MKPAQEQRASDFIVKLDLGTDSSGVRSRVSLHNAPPMSVPGSRDA